jgi:hypothetical protein
MNTLDRIKNEIEHDVLERLTSYIMDFNDDGKLFTRLDIIDTFKSREGITEPQSVRITI